MIAGVLEVQMLANMARLQSDMTQAKGMVGSAMGSIEKAVASAKTALGMLGIGVGVGYFASLIKGSIDLADSLNKLSQRTGVAVETLSQMQYAAKLADVSNETLTKSYRKLNVSIAEGLAGDAKKIAIFKTLGITTSDLGKGTQEVMLKIADAYAKSKDGAGKVAIGNELMGKSADEMIPLLNGGSQAIRDLMKEADKLGLTISTEFAAKAEEFNDNLTRIKTSSQKLSIALAGDLVESLGKAMKAMADATVAGGRLQGVITFIQTLFTGTDQHKNNVALVEDAEKLMRAEKALADARSSGMNPIGIAAREKLVNDLKDRLKTTLTYRKLLTEEEDKSLAAAAKLEALRKNGKELKLPGTDAKLIAAELKLYEGAVKSLSDKLGNLEHQTESEKLAFEEYGKNVTLADGTIVHLTGSLEKLTPAHKAMLVIIAAEVDARKQAIEVSKNWVDAINAEIAVQEKLDSLQSDYNLTNSQTAKELQFQIDLIGKTTAEQQQLTAARQIDLDLQNKLLEAARIPGITPESLAEMEALLTAAAGRQKTIIAGLIAYKLGKERAWATGAKEAYDEYVDNATNAARQAKELYSAMYKGMEDDAFNFFRHGELSASNFVGAIEDQLARLAAQKFTVWVAAQIGIDGAGVAAAGGASGSTAGGLIGGAAGYAGNALGLTGAGSFASGWSGASAAAGSADMITGGIYATTGTAEGIGAGAYSALSAVPVAGWIALAVVAAYEIFHKEWTSAQNLASASVSYSSAGVLTGQTNSPEYAAAATADKVLKGLGDGYAGLLRSLGATGAAATFGFGANTGREGQNPNFTLSAQVGAASYMTTTDNASLFAPNEMTLNPGNINLEVSRVLLLALENSTLPKSLQGVFDGMAPAGMTQAQIDTALATAQSFADLHTQLLALPFANLKDLSYSAAQGLVAAAGGMQNLGANLGSFYQNFYRDSEKTANLTSSTAAAFTALGLTMPAMDSGARDAYRAMVQEAGAKDLSVAANAQAYASLLALNGAVNTLAPAFDAAAKAVRSASDILNENTRLQDQYDNLTMTSAQLLDKQRSALDASNVALFDQVQAAQAAKDANDALTQSNLDAAAAASQLAATNKTWQDQIDILTGKQTEHEIALRDASDDSTRALMRQVYAMQDASSSMDSFTQTVMGLVDGIHNSVTGSIFQMRYGLQDSAGQYGMLDAQAKQFDELMRASTDINQIAKYAQSEIDTINKAFSLLDPSQQQSTLDRNVLLLDKIDSFVTGSGADAVSRKRADNAELSAAVAKAVKEAMADLAIAQTNAAIAQADAASKIEKVVREPANVNVTVSAPRGSEVSVS